MAEDWPILLNLLLVVLSFSDSSAEPCPSPCTCLTGLDDMRVMECNRKRLSSAPLDVPAEVTQVSLNHNELTLLPSLGDISPNITSLSLIHNRISEVSMHQLQPYVSLESLDLTSNSISELKVGSFPSMQLKYLNLSNNRISILEAGCFENISSSLLVLKLNRNRLVTLPSKVFKLPQLQFLEMKRNKIKVVDSLTFKGMDSLKSLKLQRNGITKLMDGAFFGLNNIEELELEHNNLTEVNKGWLYGLRMLRVLGISQNAINIIRSDAWEFCQNLEELDLSFNYITRLEETVFIGLGLLESLNLGDNSISHLGEGVFASLRSVRTLDIRNNEISWAIEDSIGVFEGMKKLNTLILQRNKIKSITKKAFEGPRNLSTCEDLSKNEIMSIHPEALSHVKLKMFILNTSSLLCDCHMQWLASWLTDKPFQQSVSAVCAHPATLLGQSVLDISPDHFVCDDFPKPHITVHPETSVALRGNNVTLSCVASSSSDSPMTTAWRKDGEVLYDAEVQNYARYQDTELIYTTVLHLLNVNFTDEGRYQCVVSNHFGSNYSNRAKLTVNEMPSFLKTPMDLTIRTGTMARLECAAEGHPSPQIAWRKDGGTDFPAARERRMHVMPDDDIFFIANVKTEDMGVYSCTAQNAAGSLSANATLTVLETPSFMRPLEDRTVARGETAVLQCIAGGSPAPRLNWTKDDGPLVLTERHFFAAYTCIMSNTLGTERGHIFLSVSPSPNCETGVAYDQDGWTTVGIVVIVVVCCVVGTSLVWVIVIYHMRRKNEDYSITNTDEINLPADIPSYLSSQGTLSEPPEGYSNSEAGSHQQLMPPLSNGYVHKGTDAGTGPLVICSDCYDNANIYSRTREYCQYAYLGEDDAVDKSHKTGFTGRAQHNDSVLENFISNQYSSGFLSSNNKSLNNHTAPVHSTNGKTRSMWNEGEDLPLKPQTVLSHIPVTIHGEPLSSSMDGTVEHGESAQEHRSASNRTNLSEHLTPT
uniref:Leucine-rich repeats and immunoglobulin-like domains 2 n=1 Tax=Neogobius melanostomus TaxID=47308 RepID=A0A8C6V195_9GOBI